MFLPVTLSSGVLKIEVPKSVKDRETLECIRFNNNKYLKRLDWISLEEPLENFFKEPDLEDFKRHIDLYYVESYFQRYAIPCDLSDVGVSVFSWRLSSLQTVKHIFQFSEEYVDGLGTFDFKSLSGQPLPKIYMSESCFIKEILKSGRKVVYDTETNEFTTPYLFTSKPISSVGVTPFERYGKPLMSTKHSEPALKLFRESSLNGTLSIDEVCRSFPKDIRDCLFDEHFPWFGDINDLENFFSTYGYVEESMRNVLRKAFGKKVSKNITNNDCCVDNRCSRDKVRAFPSGFKMALWSQSNDHKCGICGKPIESYEDCEVDHIIPHSHGGKTEPDNAQLTHKVCNRGKRDKMPV